MDYYDILGVPPNASDEDIKRAFHKLAYQYHPDRPGGNEQKFKEINEAYQVLSNKKTRTQYDTYRRYGNNNFQQGFSGFQNNSQNTDFDFSNFGFGNQSFGFDFNDLFSEFFSRQYQPRNTITTIELVINPIEAMLGTKKEIQWDKKKLIVNIPKGIDSGTILRLRGKKNLLIKVVIKTPKKISKKAEELLKELRNEIY